MLTGAAEPGGRLPITFPADEQRTPIETASQYPGVDGVASYSEELLVGYRWYDARGVEPAYPFGFGLGYTTFELSGVDVDGGRGRVPGQLRGAEHRSAAREGRAPGLRRVRGVGR